jgi:hypothetical protein
MTFVKEIRAIPSSEEILGGAIFCQGFFQSRETKPVSIVLKSCQDTIFGCTNPWMYIVLRFTASAKVQHPAVSSSYQQRNLNFSRRLRICSPSQHDIQCSKTSSPEIFSHEEKYYTIA